MEKGRMIAEGKTKRIFEAIGTEDEGCVGECVVVENKSDITAHDDPSLTRQFAAKAHYATTTTCRIFELLNACYIPTAYQRQLSETEFLMKRSEMVPLEVVARRYAVGSYLKRHPELTPADPKKPHRFHRLEVEFFLKTTGGKFGDVFSDLADKGGKKIDDPLIVNAKEDEWRLIHSKKPDWSEESALSVAQIPHQVGPEAIEKMDKIVRQLFLVLEKAWANLGIDLIDIKVEFDSLMRVSDVVDNDSWRLWQNGEQLDKQVFRDKGGAALDEIEKKYGQVAELVNQLYLPKQAIVFWRGSDKDPLPENFPAVPGITIGKVALSGHKGTFEALKRLERIFSEFPQGGVIICSVGRSNGLGPILAAHSVWPVIACPATLKEFPDDIWSSLRMPSGVPLLTAWPEANALDAALGILAQTNPAAYMELQLKKESFDNFIA